MAKSQGLMSPPRKPSKARKARKYASCTMSSASGRERTSQNAKLNAASMHGIARGSNCGRELKVAQLAVRGAGVPPCGDNSLPDAQLFPTDHVWLKAPATPHKPERGGE